MAHNAELLDRLIKTIFKSPSAIELERCRHSALRTLANSHSARINQFEITARLDGLEEKWMIHNNDPLADALHLRRGELSLRSDRWTPEILSLLLQLSDRPIDHPNLADLALLKPELPSTPLTWADIVARDPVDDQDGIWKNVDFAEDDSDDNERTDFVQSDHSVLAPEPSLVRQAVEVCLEKVIEPIPKTSLRAIQSAQSWNRQEDDKFDFIHEEDEDCTPKTSLTELQVGRDVIFTLLGLPSSIFNQEIEGQISVSTVNLLEHTSQESLTGLLHEFAAIASKLLSIRQWVGKDVMIPLEQTFQAALVSRLESVDRTLSVIQTKMLSQDTQAVTSLLKLYDEITNTSRHLLQLHDILLEVDVNSKFERPFRILECLFDRTCINQVIGDAEGYEYMANLFFDCFQTYLKPLRLWMEKGQLTGRDGVIFIKKTKKDVHLDFLWRDQYHLIETSNGLHAPRFLHVAARKIFNTGKSVDFLRHLGWECHDSRQDPPKEAVMTYESVCQPSSLGLFSPFAELFDMALNKWIATKYQASSSELRAQLTSHCGLRSSLDALEYIYFANTDLNNRIFEKMDRRTHRWSDGFVTTELLHSTFNSIPCVEIDRLKVCPNPANRQEIRGARRSMSALEDIRVSYKLHWPVANVIRTETIEVYQRIFVFLTQLQRAKYLLQWQKPLKNVQAADKNYLLRLYALRHRLLWLTNTMLTYITFSVLAVATAEMRIAMDRAEDVDTMIAIHKSYITKLEDECLLKHTSIRQAITSLLDLSILFSDLQGSCATRQISSNPERRFAGTGVNEKRAIYSKIKKAAKAAPDDEDSEYDSGSDYDEPHRDFALNAEIPDVGKLKHVLDTFRNLLQFVTTAVRGMKKCDSAPSWENLANNLAIGLER